MAKFIPTYRQTQRKVIKMCLSCNCVEELAESVVTCPSCGLIGYLGFWETPEKFQRYIKLYKPSNLNVVGDHLQYIVDEGLDVI